MLFITIINFNHGVRIKLRNHSSRQLHPHSQLLPCCFPGKKTYSSSIFTHPYAQFLFTTQNPFQTPVNYLICFDIFLTYLFCFLGGKFPDEQLKDATRVVREVREKVGKKEGVGLYVMADTTYGSCCVDEVGASHINADSVIHFGHTCLSP